MQSPTKRRDLWRSLWITDRCFIMWFRGLASIIITKSRAREKLAESVILSMYTLNGQNWQIKGVINYARCCYIQPCSHNTVSEFLFAFMYRLLSSGSIGDCLSVILGVLLYRISKCVVSNSWDFFVTCLVFYFCLLANNSNNNIRLKLHALYVYSPKY